MGLRLAPRGDQKDGGPGGGANSPPTKMLERIFLNSKRQGHSDVFKKMLSLKKYSQYQKLPMYVQIVNLKSLFLLSPSMKLHIQSRFLEIFSLDELILTSRAIHRGVLINITQINMASRACDVKIFHFSKTIYDLKPLYLACFLMKFNKVNII